MTGEAALLAELDRWAAAGRTATFWWRDDDAAAAGGRLDALLAAARAAGVPLALAVVPATAGSDLVQRLARDAGEIAVLQHGYAHANHAGPGEKKAEFGPARARDAAAAEIAAGRDRLRALFAQRLLPVFVPPWNRIAAPIAGDLHRLGIAALSTFGARRPLSGMALLQVNTHADPIDWHGGRSFLGIGFLGEALATHLAARRLGTADPAEPTGLLTHHLDLDPAELAAIGELVGRIAAHPAARWPGLHDIFAT